MSTKLVEVLQCGAKNSTIARELNELGYCYLVYGWDRIEGSVLYECVNDGCFEWIEHSVVTPQIVKTLDDIPEFHRCIKINPSDVAVLKQMF